jgi:uncharacterized protein YggU (UPF0235/DUF167 family)
LNGSPARPWKIAPDGLSVTVRATPKGGRDAIDGVDQLSDGTSVLKVRVRAAPDGGEANAAIIRTIAKTIGIGTSTISLVRGATNRIKVFRLAGNGAALAALLERALAGGKHNDKSE